MASQQDKLVALITVKSVEFRSEGERNGYKWKRYLVTDTLGSKWGTFIQGLQSGSTYHVEYDENAKGRTIKKVTQVPPKQYMDIPEPGDDDLVGDDEPPPF